VHERLSEEELLAYAGQFDGALCGDDRFTLRVLEACLPRLKVISKWGTGIDSIDKVSANKLGIQVRNTPNAFTLPVSDSVLGYILAFARRQPWMDRAVKAGAWEKLPGRSLSECTLGVIGVGNIGKAVMRRARAFGMKLLGTDIIPMPPEFIVENGVEMTSLPDLLARADFVSVNCDLNSTSRHIINAQTLDRGAAGWQDRRGGVGRLRSRAAAGRVAPARDGSGHAGGAQHQFQPGRLGAGSLEYDSQFIGRIGQEPRILGIYPPG
jgi:D-3-phosphoglycerate dehydrogenase / 2-oxoglutarate reductase